MLLCALAPSIRANIALASSGPSRNPKQCASFNGAKGAGIPGYFAMYNDGNGAAYYNFNIDMTTITSSMCPSGNSTGYTYHLHTSWANLPGDSAQNATNCGISKTGNHYDPSLACGPSSQYQKNSCGSWSQTACCVEMGRVVGKYNYSCTPSIYNSGNYSNCERGDFSGKFGVVVAGSNGYINSDTLASNGVLVDYIPYFNSNYMTNTVDATMWTSLVVHCKTGGARVLCAKFSSDATDLSYCSDGFTAIYSTVYPGGGTSNSNNDATVSSKQFNSAIAATFFPTLFVGLFLGFLFHRFFGHYFVMKNQNANVM